MENIISPRVGLLLAHRIIWSELQVQAQIRDRAKRKRHTDAEEEAEYAVGILRRVAERVSTEAKKHDGRTPNK